MGTCDLCWKISCGHYPASLLGYYASLGKNAQGFDPNGIHRQSLVGLYVAHECLLKALHQSEFMYQFRTVSPLPSSLGFFLLNKIFLSPSSKWSVSWLYYCSDVERLVAGWPCFWFYGRGQLWQQRCGHTLHSVVRLLLRWSEVQCQFYSTWEAVNVGHLVCENLDPQGRAEGDKCLTRGTIKA